MTYAIVSPSHGDYLSVNIKAANEVDQSLFFEKVKESTTKNRERFLVIAGEGCSYSQSFLKNSKWRECASGQVSIVKVDWVRGEAVGEAHYVLNQKEAKEFPAKGAAIKRLEVAEVPVVIVFSNWGARVVRGPKSSLFDSCRAK